MNELTRDDVDGVEITVVAYCEFCGKEETFYIDLFAHNSLQEGIAHTLNQEGWGLHEGQEMIGVCCGCEEEI